MDSLHSARWLFLLLLLLVCAFLAYAGLRRDR